MKNTEDFNAEAFQNLLLDVFRLDDVYMVFL